jgi:hypothetical protein
LVLLNEGDPQEQDRLTEKWRDHKLQELNFIGVVVGFCPIAHILIPGTHAYPQPDLGKHIPSKKY